MMCYVTVTLTTFDKQSNSHRIKVKSKLNRKEGSEQQVNRSRIITITTALHARAENFHQISSFYKLTFWAYGPQCDRRTAEFCNTTPREGPYNKHQLFSHSRKKVPVHYGWTPFKMQHIKRYAVTY